MTRRRAASVLLFLAFVACASNPTPPDRDGGVGGEEPPTGPVFWEPGELVMGVDLSYARQVLEHGGTYRDSAGVRSPYAIFADHGANTVRLRLWHDPRWVRDTAYDDPSVPLYGGLDDAAWGMREAARHGMEVNLDLHYSDTWADPGRQEVPEAWRGITDLEVLADSVYRYTRGVLERLGAQGLVPAMVQVGNEINCGMLLQEGGEGFPELSVCDGHWEAQGRVLNAGIRAVREAAPGARVVLHVAQPENVGWWLEGITTGGAVTDFDVVGFSYYANWSDQPLSSIAGHVAAWRRAHGKDVMIMETAYPWTLENADAYPNILGRGAVVEGYPATPAGQRRYLVDLVRQVVAGGGSGVFYWEPAWITSELRDLWGTGSSWDNATLFDFQGRALEGMEYLTWPYEGVS